MIKRTENWLLGLTCRDQLVLLLYLHCTQYQPFLQEFLSVTVPSTSESYHSALGPSSLAVVLCQMGCYVPVQKYYLFICSLFTMLVGWSRAIILSTRLECTKSADWCLYRRSHLCKSKRTEETELA